MPLMPGLLRRRGQSSEVDMGRHSFYAANSVSNPSLQNSRASEQIPRRPSAAEFLSPDAALDGTASPRRISEGDTNLRAVSPPIQEDGPKHRRFSMLKFRHASESQLALKGMEKVDVRTLFKANNLPARQQADSQPVPAIPQRMSLATPHRRTSLT
jgi:hypothetical protein